MTAAVELLKALLIESIQEQASAAIAADLSTSERHDSVEIEECASNDQNNP
jgi:hypothetical protein